MNDPLRQHFSAVLIGMENMDAAYIQVPFSVHEAWGKRGLVKVKAWFDGYLYRGSIAKMQKGDVPHILIVVQAVRKAIGKKAGDMVDVVLEQDFDERILEVPPILSEALEQNKTAAGYFHKLAYSHRKEYIVYITDAKKEETRIRRVEKVIGMLLDRKKNPTDKTPSLEKGQQ
jgi:hypothetical protein